MSLITTLDHINIHTANLEETRKLFVDVLGLEIGYRPYIPFGGYWLYLGKQSVVHIIEIEKGRVPSKSSSLDHFCFNISDVDEAMRRLDAAGLEYEINPIPGTTVIQLFVLDCNGVTVELQWPGPKGYLEVLEPTEEVARRAALAAREAERAA